MPKRIRNNTDEQNPSGALSVHAKEPAVSASSVESSFEPVYESAGNDPAGMPKPADHLPEYPVPAADTAPQTSQAMDAQLPAGGTAGPRRRRQSVQEAAVSPVETHVAAPERNYDVPSSVVRQDTTVHPQYRYYNATVDKDKDKAADTADIPEGRVKRLVSAARDRIGDRVDRFFSPEHPQPKKADTSRDSSPKTDPIPLVRRSEQVHIDRSSRRSDDVPGGPRRSHEGRQMRAARDDSSQQPEPVSRPRWQTGTGVHRSGKRKGSGILTLVDNALSSDIIRRVIMAALAGVALFSLIMIIRIIDRSIRTSRVNSELAEMHSQVAQNVDTESLIIYSLPETGENEPDDDDSEENAFDNTFENSDETFVAMAAEYEETPEPEPDATPKPAPLVATTVFHKIGGEALPEMAALYKENSDIIGWLNINGVLDLPVVYKNNVYYLTHDFYKKNNTSGTLFLDENHPFKAKTQNLLFHGHNMRDGSMFGRLIQYKNNLPFLKSNFLVDFSSLWQHEQYIIFAVLQVSLNPRDSSFFNYFTHSTFRTDEEFTSYVTELMSRSMYAIPVDVKPSDPLITLSTCLDDDRLIIVARKRRDGESHQRLRELVSTAVRQ